MTLVSRRRAVRVAGAAAVLLVATACSSGTAPSAAAPSATTDHIHGIYRDPTSEYGAKFAS